MCTRGSRVATLLGILATLKLFTSTNGEWKPCVPTMYICPSVSPSVRMYFDPSVLPSVCMFIRQSVRMYICLSVPSFRMSICSSVRSYVYLSVSPFVCLFVRQSECLFFCHHFNNVFTIMTTLSVIHFKVYLHVRTNYINLARVQKLWLLSKG